VYVGLVQRPLVPKHLEASPTHQHPNIRSEEKSAGSGDAQGAEFLFDNTSRASPLLLNKNSSYF